MHKPAAALLATWFGSDADIVGANRSSLASLSAAPTAIAAIAEMLTPMTHAPETGAINRLHFWRRLLVPYASGMKNSVAKINVHG